MKRAASSLCAASLLGACAATDVEQFTQAALSKDPKAALQHLTDQKMETYTHLAEQKVETYTRNPQQLLADFDRLKQELQRRFGHVRGESEKKWGKEEAETLPTPKRYVKYTQQYNNRTIVDYERGTIRIEHLQETGVNERLRHAVVVALLTPEDPRSTDVFSDSDVVLDGKPFLQDMVRDQSGKVMTTRSDVEKFASYLVANRLQHRRISVEGQAVVVAFVQMEMIGAEDASSVAAASEPERPARRPKPAPGAAEPPRTPKALVAVDELRERPNPPNLYGHADRLAPKFKPLVEKYAQKTGLDPALIFGVIFQESRFNPHAVSAAGAFGMMQLSPSGGGFDAFHKAKGASVQPTKEYLMDPENNIELGAIYLNMLVTDYWCKSVTNPESRQYCAIAAYNTGAGNVVRSLAGNTHDFTSATHKANAMSTAEFYEHLRVHLPFQETRDYVPRVGAARTYYRGKFYNDSVAASGDARKTH
jgi:membrane-bound lytic murein transglycosylase C